MAREHGIVTPYTSYLILEDERRRVSRRELDFDDQTLGSIAPGASGFAKRSKKEYGEMKKKSGQSSVQASAEFQALNNANNIARTRQGKSRLGFRNKKGDIINMTQQVKNIQGRAVYNSGAFWIDSRIQTKKWTKTIRIRFASREYFDLLKKNPKSAQFLALGRNVRFVLNNRVYVVFQ